MYDMQTGGNKNFWAAARLIITYHMNKSTRFIDVKQFKKVFMPKPPYRLKSTTTERFGQ